MSDGGREEAERGEFERDEQWRESFLKEMRKSGVYVPVCVCEGEGGGGGL